LEKRGALMETIADTVIPRQYNPTMLPHGTQPFLITCILGEMIIMQLDLCPCLSKGICHDVFPETAIKKKDQRVYAAWVFSSHRMASSMSQGGRS
jgi:hypothetical protein